MNIGARSEADNMSGIVQPNRITQGEDRSSPNGMNHTAFSASSSLSYFVSCFARISPLESRTPSCGGVYEGKTSYKDYYFLGHGCPFFLCRSVPDPRDSASDQYPEGFAMPRADVGTTDRSEFKSYQ